MLKTTILIRQADGSTRELEIVNGATVSLNGNEQLLIAADLAQAEVRAEGEGKVAVWLEGVGEFTVESEGLPPEVVAMGPDEAPAFRGQPVIVFERAGSGGDESVVHEPLGVHEASVADTAFLEQRTGEDFGMGSPLADMASFSAEAGAGLGTGRDVAGADGQDALPMDGLDDGSGRHQWIPRNQPPVVEINTTLLVDDGAAGNLLDHLRATDRESGPQDLRFTLSQGPAYGTLLVDGKGVDAAKVTFTQADLDSGRVTFRFDFDPQAQGKVLVIDGDTFVFTVTDGTDSTGPATFRIQNTTVQVWGTAGDDDLTGVADFGRDGAKFHVYGFDGNDTLRGGAGADTLDGGGGSDTADYSGSDAPVDVDLNRERQTGGHAEGDVLRDIENVIGSDGNDIILGDGSGNCLDGGAGDDVIHGGYKNRIFGGAGDDTIYGDTGNNAIYRAWGSNTIFGGAGNDVIHGGNENKIFGGAGDDVIYGGKGYYELEESPAIPLPIMSEYRLIRIYGDDFIDGGSGDDYIDCRFSIDNLVNNGFMPYREFVFGDDTIYGGAGNDTI